MKKKITILYILALTLSSSLELSAQSSDSLKPILISFPWSAESDRANSNFGNKVATAGDVNGDGYSDVIVSEFNFRNSYDKKEKGRVFVFYGSRTGLSKSPNWIAKGDQNGGAFGKSASMAGDVNGDGYSDVIIGAYGYNDKEGMVFVYYGSLTGLSKTANWSAEGNEEKSNFGSSVATAGDVNGDKFSDVIISAEDRVFVYYGSTNGLSKTPNWSSIGSKNNVYFGNCVSTAGDVNGDGFSDIIIGDFGYNNEEGMVFVYYGSPIGLSKTANWTAKGNKINSEFGACVSNAGDINDDGFGDIIVGSKSFNKGRAYVYYGSASGLSESPNWTVEGKEDDSMVGISVAAAGDFNDDGFGDVIVGAYLYRDLLQRYPDSLDKKSSYLNKKLSYHGGAALIFFGSDSGLSKFEDLALYIENDPTPLTYDPLTGFGYCVATAGNVNGDKFNDIIIGAPKYGEDRGKAFVYYGSKTGSIK